MRGNKQQQSHSYKRNRRLEIPDVCYDLFLNDEPGSPSPLFHCLLEQKMAPREIIHSDFYKLSRLRSLLTLLIDAYTSSFKPSTSPVSAPPSV
jgi:hypothetical protein